MGQAPLRRRRSAPCCRSPRIRSVDDELRALTDPEAALALSGWIYLLLAVAVAVDSIIPILPAEVLCVGAGALAASGASTPASWSASSPPVDGRRRLLLPSRAFQRRPRPARHALQPRPSTTLRAHRARTQREPQRDIVGGRFVPGGRTCVGVLCGIARQPRSAYTAASAAGMALWAVYVVGLDADDGETDPW